MNGAKKARAVDGHSPSFHRRLTNFGGLSMFVLSTTTAERSIHMSSRDGYQSLVLGSATMAAEVDDRAAEGGTRPVATSDGPFRRRTKSAVRFTAHVCTSYPDRVRNGFLPTSYATAIIATI